MLRWGRPKAVEGGEVGARSAGEGAGARGGEGGYWSGWRRAEPLLLFIIIKIFENICDIKILMIISQIDIFENV